MKKNIYSITLLDTSRLDQSSFYQLMSECCSAISTYLKKEKDQLYLDKNGRLKTLLEEYHGGLHQSRGGKVSAKLEAADQKRDAAYMTISSLIKAFARVETLEIADAYESLNRLMRNYKGLTTATYEKETEGVNHLLAQLAQEKYQTALTTLHLNPYVESLKAAQVAFEEVYSDRLKEQQAKVKNNNKSLRNELQEIYDFLIDFTAINAYAYPEKSDLVELHDKLNIHRSRYKKSPKKIQSEVIA